MSDEDIEIGLQLPQAVDNNPTQELILPNDNDGAVVTKCTAAISKEVQRVLFKLFEKVDIDTKTFRIEAAGYPEEDVADLKSRLVSALRNLKTALFSAKINVVEQEKEYQVEGIVDGPNMQQVKKFIGTLEIIRVVDGLRAQTNLDINNLDIVIGRSKKVANSQPGGVELKGKEKKRYDDAQTTIDDRTPKLEQKQLAQEEINGFMDQFMRIKTIDVDTFWKGAQTLIDNLDKGNYLDEKEKAQLTDLKKICAELRAECVVPKEEEPETIPKLAPAKKRGLIYKLIMGFYVFSTLLAIGAMAAGKYYSFTRTTPLHKTKVMKTLAAREGLKAKTTDLLAVTKHEEQKLSGTIKFLVNYLADEKATKIPANATEKKAVQITNEKITAAVQSMMKMPFAKPLMKPEQLSGKIPAVKFINKFKGKIFTAEARIAKYHQKVIKKEDIIKIPHAKYQGTRIRQIRVLRQYVVITTFSEPFKKHSTRTTREVKVTYYQETPPKKTSKQPLTRKGERL